MHKFVVSGHCDTRVVCHLNEFHAAANSDLKIVFIMDEELSTEGASVPGQPLALTAAQHGIWVGQALDPANPAYLAAEYLELAGAIDFVALSAAFEQALREADALHVRFEIAGELPRQVLATRS